MGPYGDQAREAMDRRLGLPYTVLERYETVLPLEPARDTVFVPAGDRPVPKEL